MDVQPNDNVGTGTNWDKNWNGQKNMLFSFHLSRIDTCFASEKLGQTGTTPEFEKIGLGQTGTARPKTFGFCPP